MNYMNNVCRTSIIQHGHRTVRIVCVTSAGGVGADFYESMVRVPLIVAGPGVCVGGRSEALCVIPNLR